ncbi:hypothetical protein AB0G02_23575 [Actinosynnema sp. NPDC023658]|uniref:effector-associated constant component EACC1 n=1 Tax=Actinosynnema sp. NPDC023658 TaxID=3155465 RepID=UPI0033E7F127
MQRRSDVTVTVTAPDGRKVSLNAKRTKDPEKPIRDVLGTPASAGLSPGRPAFGSGEASIGSCPVDVAGP